ncbi:hypothetical protein [Shewanella phage FishSpeaker]|nr:hypothetical protein [Shewanella phage FishSpeaker]
MSSLWIDPVFKLVPPTPDHPGYDDWVERMFILGYENPYDAYFGSPSRPVSFATTAAVHGAISGVVAATVIEGTPEEKLRAGLVAGGLTAVGSLFLNIFL